MMRVRLKADGRLVEIMPDGSERALPKAEPKAEPAFERKPAAERQPYVVSPSISPDRPQPVATDASYARHVRTSTRLTQAQFAARIGVPIETVRNWEQGKRSPRGPARALLRFIHNAPSIAFDALDPRHD